MPVRHMTWALGNTRYPDTPMHTGEEFGHIDPGMTQIIDENTNTPISPNDLSLPKYI